MTIGEKIKKYRTFKGLTQAQLGKLVGLSGDRIRQYESDVRTPKQNKLFEIADALGVNAVALSDPDLDNTNSIMHIFFELEEQYGLRFDKTDDGYLLSFPQNKESGASWLKNGLNDWIRKRNELQPDINDSTAAIEQKKYDYALWKARYPYSFGEQMNELQEVLNEFHSSHMHLLPESPKQPETFSDFYECFLALVDTGLDTAIDFSHDSPDNISIRINQEQLFDSSDDVIAAYMTFAHAVDDMRKIGINCLSFSCRTEDDKPYIFFNFENKQMITLLFRFKSSKEKLDSEIIDESAYEADMKDTFKMYNIPIKDNI
jgi:transcriptional regulator with XRE-family HTH domain